MHFWKAFAVGRWAYKAYKKIEENYIVERRRRTTAVTVITAAIFLGATYAVAWLLPQTSSSRLFAFSVLWLMIGIIISRMVLMVRYLANRDHRLALRLLRLNMAGTACLIVMVPVTWFCFPEKFEFGVILPYIKDIWQWL